jgi:hypothetical protein
LKKNHLFCLQNDKKNIIKNNENESFNNTFYDPKIKINKNNNVKLVFYKNKLIKAAFIKAYNKCQIDVNIK